MADLGVPVYSIQIVPGAIYQQVRVLETRRDKRRHRKAWKVRAQRQEQQARMQQRAQRREWRHEYPWHERYPNIARVLFWTLVLATVAFFVFADRLTPYIKR